jgi:hypothetical protein
VAATGLKHLCAVEINLCRRAVAELDLEPVGLVGFHQRQSHWRILIAHVQEQDVVRGEPRVNKGYQRFQRNFCENRANVKRLARLDPISSTVFMMTASIVTATSSLALPGQPSRAR